MMSRLQKELSTSNNKDSKIKDFIDLTNNAYLSSVELFPD